MVKIKFDTQTLKLMSYFEANTGSKLKDCFVDDNGTINFIVQQGLRKAIGKKGTTFKRIEQGIKKKIKLVAYSDDLVQFIKNLILPQKVKDIEHNVEEKTVTILAESDSRGYIIGRAARNLRNYESIAKRYFDIKEIKVV